MVIIVIIIITTTMTSLTILYIMHACAPDIVVDVEDIG